MKRILMICFISLLTLNVAFSQNTYPKTLGDSLIVITPTQLKETNLIFLEHEKLLKLDSIHVKQIDVLEQAIQVSLELDSVYNSKLNSYYNELLEKDKKNEKLIKKNRILRGLSCLLGGTTLISILISVL